MEKEIESLRQLLKEAEKERDACKRAKERFCNERDEARRKRDEALAENKRLRHSGIETLKNIQRALSGIDGLEYEQRISQAYDLTQESLNKETQNPPCSRCLTSENEHDEALADKEKTVDQPMQMLEKACTGGTKCMCEGSSLYYYEHYEARVILSRISAKRHTNTEVLKKETP